MVSTFNLDLTVCRKWSHSCKNIAVQECDCVPVRSRRGAKFSKPAPLSKKAVKAQPYFYRKTINNRDCLSE